ncbi:tcdA-E operon negative regulator [Bifidobacterium margollesii]|uniref:TcdA-E operon negative regulator n=1 Tax=Bifidobacterium margollesii TaxID=2020964 RepID=A0A2N5JC07_9BIFI|nr:hypothetical protein [Bifidobacterium margollesii]PLS31734.1 tcdA-E operon negative regulator [Bifidobacterium margollesii]
MGEMKNPVVNMDDSGSGKKGQVSQSTPLQTSNPTERIPDVSQQNVSQQTVSQAEIPVSASGMSDTQQSEPEYGQHAPTVQYQQMRQDPMYPQSNGYPQQQAPNQYPLQFSSQYSQPPAGKHAKTITLKVWQFVLSLVASAVVGFFVLLFIVAGVIEMTDESSSQASSQSTQQQQRQETENPKTAEKEKVTLESISVEYSGSTKAGTEINDMTTGISVTGEYSDGSTKTIAEGYKVKNPGKLEAGKTQKFTVIYEGREAEFSVTVEESDDQFKSSTQNIPFDELARNPQANTGKRVHLHGKVVQVIEDDTVSQYRVSVQQDDYGNWDSDHVIYVMYVRTSADSRILKNDIVDIWGTSQGTITYQSSLGGDITIPSVTARIMQVSQ